MDPSGDFSHKNRKRRRSRGTRQDSKVSASWNAENLPYETNYNDHFETPLQAYQDLEIVLKIFAESQTSDSHLSLSIYDPYYCNGRTRVLLQQLGYRKVIHERRDFYKDIELDSIPLHDVLVTNPPYSDEHKQRCFDYCFQSGKPFCLLLPNYVASRSYFRALLEKRCQEDSKNASTAQQTHYMLYLVPSQTYQYEHPEGTGHTSSPFESLWFCGIPTSMISDQTLKGACSRVSQNQHAKLWTSWSDVVHHQGLTRKRPNSHQRKAQRKRLLAAQAEGMDGNINSGTSGHSAKQPHSKPSRATSTLTTSGNTKAKKSSKYRDDQGKRKKKRF